MSFRENLIKAVRQSFKESSKEMIQANATSFDQMGMANVTPGEFAPEEITDAENLTNKGEMSNTTDFNKDDCCTCQNAMKDFEGAIDRIRQMVNISKDAPAPIAGEVKTLEIVKKDPEQERKDEMRNLYGESAFARMIDDVLEGKTCEEHLSSLTESEWSGPKDFTPDTRMNVSDVLQALKHDIGEGSEGIHVDAEYDENKDNVYKVTQIDTKLLPKTLRVDNIMLKLDGNTYVPDKPAKEFPMNK